MVTLKASIAAAILVVAIGATAAATYTVTRMSVDVTCPAAADDRPASEDDAMQRFTSGKPLPTDQGRKF